MNRFAELIDSISPKPRTILVVGAGSCQERRVLESLGAQEIFLVEPNRLLAEAARARFANPQRVRLVVKAVALEEGSHTFNVMNNEQFSSLLLPSSLLDYYPNLEVTEQWEVETTTLATLCHECGIDNASENLLIADLPCLESEIVVSVGIDTLQAFKWILIRSSEHALYHGVADDPMGTILRAARGNGFTALSFDEDAPPFVDILCIRNDGALEKLRLKERIATLAAALAAEKAKLLDVRAQSQALIAEREQLSSQLSPLSQSLQEKSNEIAGLQKTLRRNNKLLRKATADLEDLQTQYRMLIHAQGQQDELLFELREKLRMASEYYRKLNLHSLILEGDTLEQDHSDTSELGDEGSHEDTPGT
jgi:FkbM family methyltransferase